MLRNCEQKVPVFRELRDSSGGIEQLTGKHSSCLYESSQELWRLTNYCLWAEVYKLYGIHSISEMIDCHSIHQCKQDSDFFFLKKLYGFNCNKRISTPKSLSVNISDNLSLPSLG